jgi:NADPH-dependent 2,4-dienoyl-CoA reductase/sulfur reductase-like enzyme
VGGIDVEYEHHIDAAEMARIAGEYDAVYVAIGAQGGKTLKLEGADAAGVMSAVELLGKIGDDEYPDFTGKKVVVIGGGAVGLDVVEYFAPKGADTTVIEMMPKIGAGLDPITNCSIRDLMNKYNVHQRPSTALKEVRPDCFVVQNPDGSMEEVGFDYGCICMGLSSNNPVLNMLKEEFSDVEIVMIGDSRRPRRIIEGTQEGRAILKVLEKKGFID